MNYEILSKAADQARGIAIDAVHQCSSGHLGLPLGAAEIGAVLFGGALRFDPAQPRWINRDRFILSAGHGSMFLYTWLHLSGFDLPMEELSHFRHLHSKTPGHPEFRDTVGVEATTGPLGQGVANAVGYAVSAKMSQARYNTEEHAIFDQHIVALAGDGCLQEGISHEATAFAAHVSLDNLILIYDANKVTLDAMAEITQSEDAEKRFEALGWDVYTVDGHDMELIADTLAKCKEDHNGKPKLIIAQTIIGKGIPEVQGTYSAHGEGGAKFSDKARAGLGLPEHHFYVSDEVRAWFGEKVKERAADHAAWEQIYSQWRTANPALASQLDAAVNHTLPDKLIDLVPEFAPDYADATRNTGGVVINRLAEAIPSMITGSADLFGSTKNYLKNMGDFSKKNPAGRNIWFGIREHAMGAICNGIAYDGLFRASGATFTVFADYLRPPIRLAALSKLPVTYIFTHDSVGVGEDGPTHQPVETCSGLRVIPDLDVFRPGDAEETVGAFVTAQENEKGPSVILLTRQNIPNLAVIPASARRQGVAKGGYVLVRESGPLETILLASGSELHLAVAAAKELGSGTRVVSMPCFERYDLQSDEYKKYVLPLECRKRVAIEAGVTGLWYKYVGLDGRVIGIDRFGLSAPGATVFKELGITSQSVVDAAKSM